MAPKISACIITYNEEENITACIESALELCDEVVIIDSNSSDKTRSIANRLKAKVYVQEFLGYRDQKNLAIDKAKHDWVLCLDADERLDNTSLVFLNQLKLDLDTKMKQQKIYAYQFNRLTYYIYRWIRHSGWYPDSKIRLFNRQHIRWSGENIHEVVHCPKENLEVLKFDILHYSFNSISDHIKTLDKFSTNGAEAAFAKNKKSNLFIITSRSFWAGFRKIFLEFAFLDGVAGFILTGLSVAAAWAKYSKLYIMNKQREQPDFLEKNKR